MERKIGEIFEYNGEWYQCVKEDMYDYCKGCASFENLRCTTLYGNRDCWLKATCKKLEKVGEPYVSYRKLRQRYKLFIPLTLTNGILDEDISGDEVLNIIDIAIKQNTEDMEANEKTISVPEGWEFDRFDECSNIVLKKKKKELPKTWLKCLYSINDVEMIEEDSEVHKCSISDLSYDERLFDDSDRNLLPRGFGKPMLALCQLLVCRNAWWKQLGWKPDWNDRKSLKHCIHSDGYSTTDITQHSTFPRILAFPTEDTAIDFCDTFRDLIKEAKELL